MTANFEAGMADGRIAPRSGLAVKNFIDTGAGVIDADYRGQVKVLLFNHGEADFEGESYDTMVLDEHELIADCNVSVGTVKEGDRIAQLVLERVDTH